MTLRMLPDRLQRLRNRNRQHANPLFNLSFKLQDPTTSSLTETMLSPISLGKRKENSDLESEDCKHSHTSSSTEKED